MLTIGKIVKPQGLNGKLKVLPYGELDFFGVDEVFINGKPIKIKETSFLPNGIFIVLDQVDSIEKANALRNKEIQIPIEIARQILGEDRFLWQDAINCNIIVGNQNIGVVKDIDNFGSCDIVFAVSHSGQNFSFPIVDGLLISLTKNDIILNKSKFDEVVCFD